MDKQAIRDFSQRSRKRLIEDVKQKAYILGILEDKILDIESFKGGFRIKGRESGIFTEEQKKQREKLIDEIEKKDYKQVMEEAAYTWFNRFIALRFMEVNNYLPSGIRVLSSEEERKTEPDILTQMSLLDLDIDWDKIDEIESNSKKGLIQKREEIYKHLLIKQCNQLGSIMPTVFEEISDYTELLLPDNLLGENSIIRDLVESIDEYDWKIELSDDESEVEDEKGEHGIEIIGWLYQYYISEKKDEVFANLKKNIKVSKENIPAATQLFTPKWIVKYMVENSLGRLWLESHPNEELQSKWEYYLEEAEQEEEVKSELEKLKNPDLLLEDIKILDPAMGSGHILVYAFDVLYEIYLSQGYSERQIPSLILENNLYGLDIDDRAGQLAVFALMMKARSKNRRIFRRKIDLNVAAIQESSGQLTVGSEQSGRMLEFFANGDEELKEDFKYLMDVFNDAKEYGSILEVKPVDFDRLEERLEEIKEEQAKMYDQGHRNVILEKLPYLVKQGRIMSSKYDVVCTNPPYMEKRDFNKKLSTFLHNNYDISKNEMYGTFILKNLRDYTKKNGFVSMITIHTWMFISSFEKLRKLLLNSSTFISMLHLGAGTFEELSSFNVLSTSFVIKNKMLPNYIGMYVKLDDYTKPIDKIENYKNVKHYYNAKQNEFNSVIGSPIVYWMSDKEREIFRSNKKISDYTEIKQGMATSDNKRFLRYWTEVNITKIGFDMENLKEAKMSRKKWFPYNKGGNFRKWYGNNELVVNWENDGEEMKEFTSKLPQGMNVRLKSREYYFKSGITWSLFGFENFGVRIKDKGYIFDISGSSMFPDEKIRLYLLAFLASSVAFRFLTYLAPTVNFQIKNIGDLPLILDCSRIEEINKISRQNIEVSKKDWDSFENSWDFKRHPILNYVNETKQIEYAVQKLGEVQNDNFNIIKRNEERLNNIFIEIYDLKDEITPEVRDKDIAISKADRERDIKSFISYAVGCMLGRYSFIHFRPERDNIIPIADDDYFEEDIVERFEEFVEVTFGEENLEKNLDYIAETLGVRVRETSREAIRRYFLKDFYKDHVRTYKKRPIYWMFHSGKEDGFNALIYMHRYTSDTIAEVRIDYLHNLQRKYEGEIGHLDMVIDSDVSTREKNQAKKRKEKIMKQINECRVYDQAINHMANQRIEIDLDDGVEANYEKFQGIEVPGKDGQKSLKINLLARI